MDAKQLKDSILQYAMQGKLVPQDPNDEPAIELLKRIKEEKEQLIAQKIIKKEKTLPEITEGEIPFEIPESWEWVRASSILDVRDGTHDTPKYVPNGIPLVTSKNLKDGKLIMEPIKYISLEDHELIKKRSKVDPMDILFAMIGSIGNPVLIQDELEFSIKNVGLFKPMPINKVSMEYIYYYLLFAESGLRREASGAVQSFVSLSKLRQLLIPLPPLKEQIRLVEKIKELSLKWKRYEKLYELIITLDNELPSKIEKSILQYAMQGKLVEQDSTNEPASNLIERIKEEKEELIKNKIIKKEKALPEITGSEIPFDIPESWEWVRLKDISTFGNFESVQPSMVQEDDWVLDLEDIEKGAGILLNRTTNKEKNVKSNKYKFNKGNVLYGKLRPYLNKVIIAPEDGVCTTEIFPLNFLGGISPEYMQFALMSPYFVNYANRCSYGVKMPRMGTTQTAMAVIPLPPLKEQLKIVDELKRLLKTKNGF